MQFAKPLSILIEQLGRLPGIGPKSAQRLAFHILRQPAAEAERLADAIRNARSALQLCAECQGFGEGERCEICMDAERDHSVICVVEDPKDVAAVERMNEYKGVYHVLHGLVSPMDGVGPEQLKVKELLSRLSSGCVSEVVIATNPTLEGEATALYLSQVLKPLGVKVTRLAHGMPVGGDLEFADQATLQSAFEYRREL